MKALIIDSETSGLVDNHTLPLDKLPEIIDLFAVTVDLASGAMSEEFESLFRPVRPVSDEITKITGLTNEDLVDAPRFADRAGVIKSLIENAPMVIGHNLSFDKEMLDIEYERLASSPLRWPRLICTVEATVHLKGFRLNLQGLHELLFNEKFPEAHRARTDTLALVRCCVELFKRGEI